MNDTCIYKARLIGIERYLLAVDMCNQSEDEDGWIELDEVIEGVREYLDGTMDHPRQTRLI